MKREKVVIYCRVSTDKQTVHNQLEILREVIQKHNWELIGIYKDEGISGSKGRDERKGFNLLYTDMMKRSFDRILVWDVSRIGRSLQHLITFLEDVKNTETHLYIHQSGLDTSTISGRMMFQMIGVFSEFEREMISERVKMGLKRVKEKGVKLGRKTVINGELVNKVNEYRDSGLSMRQISYEMGVSVGIVHKILQTITKSIT